ncbi:hypothetical protein PWT90_04540 [Aphanocladium album]|nr:hypothetical protein PWT90_04540 [Aphanocladium album]
MSAIEIRLPCISGNAAAEQSYAVAASDEADDDPIISDLVPDQAARSAKTASKSAAAKPSSNIRQRALPLLEKELSLSTSSTVQPNDSAVAVSTSLTTSSKNGSATKRKRTEIPNSDSENDYSQPLPKRIRKKKKTPSPTASHAPVAETATEDGRVDNLWEVERIVGARIEVDTYVHWYQVKWKGWSAKHNTWEPKKNLASCQTLIEEFEKTEAEAKERLKKLNKQNSPKKR